MVISYNSHNFDVLQVNFGNYQAIVSFVNINNVHWKFLVSFYLTLCILMYISHVSGVMVNICGIM